MVRMAKATGLTSFRGSRVWLRWKHGSIYLYRRSLKRSDRLSSPAETVSCKCVEAKALGSAWTKFTASAGNDKDGSSVHPPKWDSVNSTLAWFSWFREPGTSSSAEDRDYRYLKPRSFLVTAHYTKCTLLVRFVCKFENSIGMGYLHLSILIKKKEKRKRKRSLFLRNRRM